MGICAYPGCRGEPSLKNKKGRELFCAAHEGQPCLFTQGGMCQSCVIPGSGFCKKHNAEVMRFDLIHHLRHTEAARQAQMQQQEQMVRQQLEKRGGNGQGIVLPKSGKYD